MQSYRIIKIRGKKKRMKMHPFLTTKLILLAILTLCFIEPIWLESSYETFRHREKTLDEIIQEQKEKNPLMYCFMDNESNLTAGAFNPKDGDGTPRCGVLQFKWETYVRFCVFKYGLPYVEKNVFASKENCQNWDNVKDQMECTTKMIADGYVKHWGKRTRTNCDYYLKQFAQK